MENGLNMGTAYLLLSLPAHQEPTFLRPWHAHRIKRYFSIAGEVLFLLKTCEACVVVKVLQRRSRSVFHHNLMFILNRFVLHTVNVPAALNRNHASYTDNSLEINSHKGVPERTAETPYLLNLLLLSTTSTVIFLETAKHYDISQVLPYNTSLHVKRQSMAAWQC